MNGFIDTAKVSDTALIRLLESHDTTELAGLRPEALTDLKRTNSYYRGVLSDQAHLYDGLSTREGSVTLNVKRYFHGDGVTRWHGFTLRFADMAELAEFVEHVEPIFMWRPHSEEKLARRTPEFREYIVAERLKERGEEIAPGLFLAYPTHNTITRA